MYILQSGGSVGSIVVVADVVVAFVVDFGTVVGALVVVGGAIVVVGFAFEGLNGHSSHWTNSTSSTAT